MAYILLDIIGIKDLWRINRTKAKEDCNKLWEACKARALWHGQGWKYVAFSDSVLISCGKDISETLFDKVKEEYNWFRKKLPSDMDFYLIVNHGSEIKASMEHEMMAYETDFQGKPYYMLIAGLGSDFADLFYTENEIKKRRARGPQLNENLRIYINKNILDQNVIEPPPDERLEVAGLDGNAVFYGFTTS